MDNLICTEQHSALSESNKILNYLKLLEPFMVLISCYRETFISFLFCLFRELSSKFKLSETLKTIMAVLE